MKVVNLKVWALVGLVALTAAPVDAARLTYIGSSGGSWLADGAWKDESGTAVAWVDGSTAVVGDINLTLPSDVSAEGIEWATTTKRTLTGAGRLTLGAGGIVNGGGGEVNFQNQGGLHLAADQTWHTAGTVAQLICLDGQRSVTTAAGVTLTVTGQTCLRWDAKASLPASTTVHIVAPAYISVARGSATLGDPTVILDGSGTRANFGGEYDGKNCVAGVFASTLHLRNSACIYFQNTSGYETTFGVPRVVVDGTQTANAPSRIHGPANLKLTSANTVFEVAEGCVLNFTVTGAEEKGVAAAFAKTGLGTMTLGSTRAAFSGGVDVRGGTLEIVNAAAGSGRVTAAAGTTVVLPTSGTLPNDLSGAGTFEKRAAGELTLAGAATDVSGKIVVSAGTLRAVPVLLADGTVTLQAGAVWTVLDDAVFETDVAPKLGAGSAGSIWAGAGTTLTVSSWNADAEPALDAEKGGLLNIGALAGEGWTKTAAGDVRIGLLEGYTGATLAVAQGVLLLESPGMIPAGCVVETSGEGIVQFDTAEGYDASKVGGTQSVAFADGASTTVDTSSSDGVPSRLAVAEGRVLHVTALTGTGDFYKTGAGTIELAGAESFAGRIIVQGGTLRVTGAVGEKAVVVENGLFTATGSGTVLRNSFEVKGGTLQAEGGASLGAGALTLAAA
ncbi:MAG: autotransporter-associated beta strand repeat-containing protein, partial [Kiritimatiellia bacterium]